MIYWQLFWLFFRISLIAFGGVFGVLPELQQVVVDQYHWLSADQFVQSYVVGQFVPGPNMSMAALVGYRIAGVGGALSSIFGIYSGPIVLLSIATTLYSRYRAFSWVKRTELAVRPLVFGLIFASTALFLKQQIDHQWLSGLLLGVPLIWLHWTGNLGAMACIFLAGFVWWGIHVLGLQI